MIELRIAFFGLGFQGNPSMQGRLEQVFVAPARSFFFSLDAKIHQCVQLTNMP